MSLVDADTGEKVRATVLMTEAEAQEITQKIKNYCGMVCVLVREAHDKQAWKALSYPSWSAYCKAEFDVSRSRSYQLVKHAEIAAGLADAAQADVSTMVDRLPERTTRDLDPEAVIAAAADAVADLPEDADEQDRVDAVMDAVAREREGAATAPPAPETQPAEENPVPLAAADHGGPSAPVVSPETQEAQQRADVSAALSKASGLLHLDPVEAAALTAAADREVWAGTVEELLDWAMRYQRALVETNRLRSVQ